MLGKTLSFQLLTKTFSEKIDSCGDDILLQPRSLEMTPMECVKTMYTYSLGQWNFKTVMITTVYLYHMWNELQLCDYQLQLVGALLNICEDNLKC